MLQKDFILKTSVVCNDDGTHCYCIERELVGQVGQTAILLTLYPSYSANDNFRLDSTAFHFLGHMEELGLNKVVTVNLFSKIVKGSKLSCRDLNVDEDNLKYLESLAKMSEYQDIPVIVAYGNSMKTSKAAQESKKRILSLFQDTKHPLLQLMCDSADTNDTSAIHPLYLGVRCQNKHWYLVPFDTEIPNNTEESLVGTKTTKSKKTGGKN